MTSWVRDLFPYCYFIQNVNTCVVSWSMGAALSPERRKELADLATAVAAARNSYKNPKTGQWKRLTQAALAKAIGCKQPVIGRIESALTEPSPSVVLKLARFFGVPAKEWLRFVIAKDVLIALSPDTEPYTCSACNGRVHKKGRKFLNHRQYANK